MSAHQAMINRNRPRLVDVSPNLTPWVASHGARLHHYFSRRAPLEDVDDLVQDVFLRLQTVRSRGPIRDVERYLFTVARHVLADRQRALRVRCSALHDALEDVAEPASDLSPERIVCARQDCARAMAAVRDLPPRAHTAFQLHRFEELSYAAIAERMAISRNSVKELLRRAATRLGDARDANSPAKVANSPRSHPPCRQTGASL